MKNVFVAAALAAAVGFAPAAASAGERTKARAVTVQRADPLPIMVIGAIVGGVAAAALCGPCAIGTTSLTTGGAIAVGAGIGAGVGILGAAVVYDHGALI